MNKCKLEIFFRFVGLDDKYMGVTIHHGGTVSTLQAVDDSAYSYVQEIELPTKVELEFFGKNKDTDTRIDAQGKIIADKHVILKGIKLDNVPVEPLYLRRRLCLEHENGVTYSNYIGFNGTMVIQFDSPNVFSQIMTFKRLGEY